MSELSSKNVSQTDYNFGLQHLFVRGKTHFIYPKNFNPQRNKKEGEKPIAGKILEEDIMG